MGFLSATLFLLSLSTLQSRETEAQEIKSARLLDLIIRDYTFRSYSKNFKTGKQHRINLPSNLSGINVDTVRFRCGSLRRYGAKIAEFHVDVGVHVHSCTKRVMIVRQNLGSKWSSLYYDNYELSGYKLISPVLGLLAYNAGITRANNASELALRAGKKPITVNFSNATLLSTKSGTIPLCATFDQDGRVTLSNQAGPKVCVATKQGHFGLVVEAPLVPVRRKASKWKITIGSTIGAALGAFLLSLLVIAVLVSAKKKARMEEMERRAYEEEALEVSMVGHVRSVSAAGTRTAPRIEHHEIDECRPPPRPRSK